MANLCLSEMLTTSKLNQYENGQLVKQYIFVKTQLNYNQVEVGLTTLRVCNPPPTQWNSVLLLFNLALSSNQHQITDKSYKTKIEFGQTKFPTQICLTL